MTPGFGNDGAVEKSSPAPFRDIEGERYLRRHVILEVLKSPALSTIVFDDAAGLILNARRLADEVFKYANEVDSAENK